MIEFKKYRPYGRWLVACCLVLPLLWVISGLERGSAPALALFVGRFHPSLVHFPIGFLFLAGVMEIVAHRYERFRGIRSAVPFVLGFAALASLAAVLAGYLLSMEGGYAEGSVGTHMWLGFVVAAAALAVLVLERLSQRRKVHANAYRSVLAGTAVLVLVTGHLGGSISRGDGYLTYYLPDPIKQFAGLAMYQDGLIANIDSAFIYQDLVAPVLERRCVKCHGTRKAEEDLRLDSPEHILEGGEGGPVIVAGKPGESDLLRRATLPPYDEDVMPPDGEAPLSIGETELIRWWIEHGASFDARVKDIDTRPSAVDVYIARIAAPRDPQRQGIFALDVRPPDTSAAAELRRMGVGVRVLLEEAPFVEITTTNVRGTFGNEHLAQLEPLSEQITWLDLSSTRVTDNGISILAPMRHLTRLHLQQTAISDSGLVHLRGLSRLEYLNLYGTRITDEGLAQLEGLTSLRSLYLWQTAVTEAGMSRLLARLPKLQITAGSSLAEVELPQVGEE